MAKTAVDVSGLIEAYVKHLNENLELERVLFVGEGYEGVGGELSDLRFIVVSSTFEGMGHVERSEKLGLLGFEVSPVIQAWAYTPNEIARHLARDRYDLFLAQFLPGSRKVYATGERGSPRKSAGGEQ